MNPTSLSDWVAEIGFISQSNSTWSKRMRISPFIAIILLALSNFGDAAGPVRSAHPAFKGVELYSWTDPADHSWWFSVCEGTNRNKILAEIMHTCVTIHDAQAIKKHLAGLAVGESVLWSSPYPELSFPPASLVRDLIEDAAANQVKLLVLE